MDKYLVVAGATSGVAELYNVGIFKGKNKQEAIDKMDWDNDRCLSAYKIDDLEDEWTYFIQCGGRNEKIVKELEAETNEH